MPYTVRDLLTAQYWREVGKVAARIPNTFREFGVAHRTWRRTKKAAKPEAPVQWALATGLVVGGIPLFVVFGTLSVIMSIRSGEPPFAILLLQKIPSRMLATTFPNWFESPALPTGLALCALYGAIVFSLGILSLSGGFLRVVLITNGLLFGYLLTYGVLDTIGLLKESVFAGRLFVPQFGYILALNYLSFGLCGLFGGSGYEREKYDLLIMGASSVITAKLLSISLGVSAEWFGGILFYSTAFVAAASFEHFLMPFMIFVKNQGGQDALTVLESERAFSLTGLCTAWRRRTPLEVFTFKASAIGFAVALPVMWVVYYLFLLISRR